jgi:hypothetical protein
MTIQSCIKGREMTIPPISVTGILCFPAEACGAIIFASGDPPIGPFSATRGGSRAGCGCQLGPA